MMKIGSGLRTSIRVAMVLLLLFPAVGCPRKTIIFNLDPSSLLFSPAAEFGSPLPDQILTMTGIGAIPHRGATFTVETDQPWLSVTPTSGLMHANEAIPLTVHTDQTGLLNGLYTGQIHIIAHYGRNTYPQTLDVTLDVIPQSPPPIVIYVEE